MKSIRAIGDRISGAVSGLKPPILGRDVELPVYLIHNSPDVEDYFFIFDFEDFVEQSRQGWFVRPKLRLWAGRSTSQVRTQPVAVSRSKRRAS